MENWMKRATELVAGLVLTNKGNPATIPYAPQKTAVSGREKPYFKRERPEKHGVSSMRLYKLLCELEAERRANVHSLLVIKDGAVVCECSHPGYSVNVRHLSHSMSKTVIGMATGLLVDDGKLSVETRVCELFPEYTARDPRFASITVEHLLTMTSGVKFSEAGSVTESDWLRAFFDSELGFEPGTCFRYNSMNSYVLSEIVSRLAGEPVLSFVGERIFKPLGIDNVFWELGPRGVEKGGWGLHLSAESWGRLGELMLGGGSFRGKRILSSDWVAKSTTTHAITDEHLGDFNYGYQLWTGRESGEFLFNGMLGQNVWVSPKNGIVAVITAGNNELFSQSPALSLVRKYLGDARLDTPSDKSGALLLREKEARFFETRHWIKPLEKRHGLKYALGLANARPFDTRWNALLGDYVLANNNQSVLPLFIRVLQNNYLGGIERLTLAREGELLVLTSREGGVDYRIPVGLYGFVTSDVDFNGEHYLVSAIAEAVETEDREPLFKIELLFPEMPNTRMMKLSLDGGRLTVRMTETPNERLALPLIDMLADLGKKASFALDFIEKQFGQDFIEKKFAEQFSPTLYAISAEDENFEARLAEENAAVAERLRTAKILTTLISKFIKPDDEEEAEKPQRRSLVSDFLGFFKGRRGGADAEAKRGEN